MSLTNLVEEDLLDLLFLNELPKNRFISKQPTMENLESRSSDESREQWLKNHTREVNYGHNS